MTPTTTAVAQLEQLRGVARERHNRITELADARKQSLTRQSIARSELSGYYRTVERGGKPNDAREAKLRTAADTAENAATEPWNSRIEGAQHAAREADTDVQKYIVENVDRLCDEYATIADDAIEHFRDACVALLEAEGRITAAAAVWNPLLPHLDGGPRENRVMTDQRIQEAVTAAGKCVHGQPLRPPIPVGVSHRRFLETQRNEDVPFVPFRRSHA